MPPTAATVLPTMAAAALELVEAGADLLALGVLSVEVPEG